MKRALNFFNKETYNVFSNFFKIAGKSFWQFFIPYVLSISSFGTYSLLQNISSVLVHTSNLGTRQIILRNHSQKTPLLQFTAHSSLLLILQLPLAAYIFNVSIGFTFLVGLIIFVTNLYNNYSAALRSLLLFKQIFFIELLGFFVFLVASLLLLKLKPSINHILLIEVFIFFTISLFLIFKYKVETANLNVSSKSFRDYLPSIYNVGFVVIADAVIWKFVPLYFLLKINNQQPNVAIFNLSLLLANAFILVPQSILETWTPGLSKELKANQWQNTLILNEKIKSYSKIFIVTICIALLATYVSVNTLYSKYLTWAYIMMVFIFIRIILTFSDFHVCVLYALKKEKLLFSPTIISSLVLIVSTYICYKDMGVKGVMMSFLLSKLVFGFLVFLYYKKAVR